MFGLEPGETFSEKLLYVYRRQIEEADVVVINKIDLLDEARIERLRARDRGRFSRARVLVVSARTGQGMEEWAALLETAAPPGRSARKNRPCAIRGGPGASRLAQFDDRILRSRGGRSAGVAETLMGRLQAGCRICVAHFKIALRPDGSDDVAVISLARRGGEPEFVRQVAEPVDTGELTINLRAERPRKRSIPRCGWRGRAGEGISRPEDRVCPSPLFPARPSPVAAVYDRRRLIIF